MKQSEMIVLGLAGVAVYLIWQSQKPKTATSGTSGTSARSAVDAFVDEIFSSTGTAFNNGWRYFENGVAIDPAGNYYQGGQLVWTKPGAYV